MSEKKIAVVFPGMGYHVDKPLLYYSKRIARSAGYEIVELKYEFPYKAREIMNDRARMKEAFEIAVSQIKEQVKEISFEEYKDILVNSQTEARNKKLGIWKDDEVPLEENIEEEEKEEKNRSIFQIIIDFFKDIIKNIIDFFDNIISEIL